MSISPHTLRDADATSAMAPLVREQLRRLLAHPLFTNSRRYPVLLAYVVERALDGDGSDLKERMIGVEAFGRAPNYDVNHDPIVRTTAAEVRKRLVQYYYQPEHANELVIELHLGSYRPGFRLPGSAGQALREIAPSAPGTTGLGPAMSPAMAWTTPELPTSLAAASRPTRAAGSAARATRFRLWIQIIAGLLAAAALGFAAGRLRLPGQPSQLDRFWQPVAVSSGRVTYCIGEPIDPLDRNRARLEGLSVYGSLNVSDVITLARSIVPLVPHNDSFRVLAASHTSFEQLREGPFVLIGAFDNPWTLRIMQSLPFGFVFENGVRKVVDRANPQSRFWQLAWRVPNTQLAHDYGVVARIHDTVTGQPVIIVAGILGEGTEAASEVVSNPRYLRAVLDRAPKNWDQLNLEAVIGTEVVDGVPGPPTILDVRTW